MDYCWSQYDASALRPIPTEGVATHDMVIAGWARALDARAQLPEGFSSRTAAMAVRLAQSLALDGEAVGHLGRGALLHDIGMMHVPDSVLRKPGALSAGEWALIRLHPMYAEELLAPIAFLRPAVLIPRYHHERWDGEGYPYGLRGDQIPLAARIFAVVGAWAAMTVDRPYRRALPPEQALESVRAGSGTLYDPEVVEAFQAFIDQRIPMA